MEEKSNDNKALTVTYLSLKRYSLNSVKKKTT